MNFIYQYRFMEHSHNASFKMRMFQRLISFIPPLNEMKFKRKYEKYIKKYNKKQTKRVVYFSNAKYLLKVVPRYYFDDVIYLPFEGYEFPAPKEWKNILKIRYGDNYMTPPPLKERISQHMTEIIDLNNSWRKYQDQ